MTFNIFKIVDSMLNTPKHNSTVQVAWTNELIRHSSKKLI